jgi:hypothetical protein
MIGLAPEKDTIHEDERVTYYDEGQNVRSQKTVP